MNMLAGFAAFLCLGCGIGCWLSGLLPRGRVASITAMAAFYSAGLGIEAASVWAKWGGGQAWPLVLISALALGVTVLGVVGGKLRGWD